MIDENDEHDEHDHDDDDAPGVDLELDTQSQIFLELRQQNLDLLEIAARVAGYMGEHGPLKPADLPNAKKAIWEVYSEFYSWIDPEETDEDDDEGEE